MLLKLEEETETPSGMRHKRHRGEGALHSGAGPSAGASSSQPQGRGDQAVQTGSTCRRGRMDENRWHFMQDSTPLV